MLMIVCLGRRASPRTSTTALAALVIASFFFYKFTKTDAYQRSLILINRLYFLTQIFEKTKTQGEKNSRLKVKTKEVTLYKVIGKN